VEAGPPRAAGAVPLGPLAAHVAHVREARALVVAAQWFVVAHDVEAQEAAAPGPYLVVGPGEQPCAEPGTRVRAPNDHAVEVARAPVLARLTPEVRVAPLERQRADDLAGAGREVELAGLRVG